MKLRTRIISWLVAFGLAASLFATPISVYAEDVPAPPENPETPVAITAEPTADPAAPTITEQPTPVTGTDPVVEAPAPTATPVPEPINTTGPTQPVGPSSDTYIYNPSTGLWENDYYAWNPVTKQTTPKQQQSYSYNPSTGRWDTVEWAYDPTQDRYVQNILSTTTPATSEQIISSDEQSLLVPVSATAARTSTPLVVSDLSIPADNKLSDPLTVSTNPSKYGSGSGSLGVFDQFFDAKISTIINSTATTGDATIESNTTAGNATTGDAQAIANVFNYMNSTWGLSGASTPLFFMANIIGAVLGDIFIDPGQIPAQQSAQSTPKDVVINSQQSGLIENDIALNTTTGDASIYNNTTAGNATTGNATAMVNVTNMINTAIGAQQSFVGVINIEGDLNGDILFPPGFLDQLLANNATNALQQPAQTQDMSLLADLQSTQNVQNNITTTATSGDATVDENTSAGNAHTGSADTKISVFNLTGRQVLGKNAMLVFVNVLGSWVGMIIDAPTGATAGLIGDSSSSSLALPSGLNNLEVTDTANHAIVNNIAVAANTGDATVSHNTAAGNATTGNAYAGVNVLNISSNSFSLADWFGILFINVLGNWYGSFGVNTDAGNPLVTPQKPNTNSATGQVFSFVPTSSTNTSNTSATPRSAASASTGQSAGEQQTTAVIAASTGSPPPSIPAATLRTTGESQAVRWIILVVGALIAAAILFEEKLRSMIAQRRATAALSNKI